MRLKNQNDQNLLHLCAIYGSKHCLFYIYNFDIINPNETDDDGNTPLYYLIKNHSEDLRKNREMFLWLSSGSNIHHRIRSEEKMIKDLFNEWQNYVYDKYVKNSFIKRYEITTEHN